MNTNIHKLNNILCDLCVLCGSKKGRQMETRRKAFTIVEILTVITIIALLVGILIPAITKVRMMVKEMQQKAQFNTITLAIGAFKNDFGYYPPSFSRDSRNEICCGSQRLAEAMFGQDLLGFHRKSTFNRDGWNDDHTEEWYPANLAPTTTAGKNNLAQRKPIYLENGTKYAFKLQDVAYQNNPGQLRGDLYLMCDEFVTKDVTITSPSGTTTRSRAGTPILYYRADTNSKVFDTGPVRDRIYNSDDNVWLLRLGRIDNGEPHTLVTNDGTAGQGGLYFYDEDYKIVDPKVTTVNMKRPYRPDSYLLISAGADGEYGTVDDITNFE